MCTQVTDHVKQAALGNFLPPLDEWKALEWPRGLSGKGVKGKAIAGSRSSQDRTQGWARGGGGHWDDWQQQNWQGWSSGKW